MKKRNNIFNCRNSLKSDKWISCMFYVAFIVAYISPEFPLKSANNDAKSDLKRTHTLHSYHRMKTNIVQKERDREKTNSEKYI